MSNPRINAADVLTAYNQNSLFCYSDATTIRQGFEIICRFLKQGEKIQAIRAIRHFYGWGLKESKDFSDVLSSLSGAPSPYGASVTKALVAENDKLKEELRLARLEQVTTKRKEVEAAWQQTLRAEAERRKALPNSIPGQPIKGLVSVDTLRTTFMEHWRVLRGADKAFRAQATELLIGINELVEADDEKQFSAREWRDEMHALVGQLTSLVTTANTKEDILSIMRDAVLDKPTNTIVPGDSRALLNWLAAIGGFGMPAKRATFGTNRPIYDTGAHAASQPSVAAPEYPFSTQAKR